MDTTNDSQQWPQSCNQMLKEDISGSIFDEEEQRSSTNIEINKNKPIQKKEKRKNTPSIKWSKNNILNYFKAVLQFSIQHPYYKISWQYWKPQKYYQRIVNFINKNQILDKKTIVQTKSFDERQRKQYFQKEFHLDIIDLAKMKLKECESTDVEAAQILCAYEQKQTLQSDHMMLLKRTKDRFDESRGSFQDICCKIKTGKKPVQFYRY